MASEIHVVPGVERALTVGAWQDAAAALVARLAPGAGVELEILFWRGGPTLRAERTAVLEDLATIRVAGAEHGGVNLVVGDTVVDLDDPDDPEARFIREHGCAWELSMSTVPLSPERDRFLSAVLAVSAGHLLVGLILKNGHPAVPLDAATAAEWEAWLATALSREPRRPADFAELAAWYARLRSYV